MTREAQRSDARPTHDSGGYFGSRTSCSYLRMWGIPTPYCLTVFGRSMEANEFRCLVNLFHPRTVDESLVHDGLGSVPGIKTDENGFEIRGTFPPTGYGSPI